MGIDLWQGKPIRLYTGTPKTFALTLVWRLSLVHCTCSSLFLFSVKGIDKRRMQETESQLIEQTRGGDREAFRVLFETYQPILFRNVLYTLQDVDEAHDVVQDTFVRVWNRRTSLQPHLPVLGYLFRISRNLVLDLAKHKNVQRRLESDIPPALRASENDPVESLHLSMLEERIAQIVRTKLPAKCREVFLLSRVEEMSNAEISRQIGISVKTVENQITRGLRILRRHLRRYL